MVSRELTATKLLVHPSSYPPTNTAKECQIPLYWRIAWSADTISLRLPMCRDEYAPSHTVLNYLGVVIRANMTPAEVKYVCWGSISGHKLDLDKHHARVGVQLPMEVCPEQETMYAISFRSHRADAKSLLQGIENISSYSCCLL